MADLFINNNKSNLLNILIVGPLFFYVGNKRTIVDARVSFVFFTLLFCTPFIFGLPKFDYNNWDLDDYSIIINYVCIIPFYYYLYKSPNKLTNNMYLLTKFIGIFIILTYSYIIFKKYE